MAEPPIDPEADARWLSRLYSLNVAIASTGEALMGNVCYYHGQRDFSMSPPLDSLRLKRDRVRAAVVGRTRLLEVGVNGGHSAYMALSTNPELEYHGVDICAFSYVRQAVTWLEEEFPGRVFFYPGDSSRILPDLAARGLTFDAFHVDGATHRYYTDIVNSSSMAEDSSVVLVDDAFELGARLAVRSLMAFGVLAAHEGFPPIDRFQPTKRVLLLNRSSPGKRRALYAYGMLLESLHRFRLTPVGRAVVPKARENPLE